MVLTVRHIKADSISIRWYRISFSYQCQALKVALSFRQTAYSIEHYWVIISMEIDKEWVCTFFIVLMPGKRLHFSIKSTILFALNVQTRSLKNKCNSLTVLSLCVLLVFSIFPPVVMFKASVNFIKCSMCTL